MLLAKSTSTTRCCNLSVAHAANNLAGAESSLRGSRGGLPGAAGAGLEERAVLSRTSARATQGRAECLDH